MSAVELIKDVKEFLLAQNQQSLEGSWICKYRGENNTKCAVGCLIPNDLYDQSFEGKTAKALFKFNKFLPVKKVIIEKYNVRGLKLVNLLTHLQKIHDLDSVLDWGKRFDELIEKYERK